VIGEVAEKIPGLEKRVMEGDFRDPESLLEELFLLRHELMTVRTMAAQEHDIFQRMSNLGDRVVPADDVHYSHDLADQFDRVRSIADGECQFLFGVIELYQTRVTTKMTLAMERLAVIAAVTLPVTAIASVYGMNVIVNGSTHWVQLILVLCAMVVISGLLLRWAHRQGWW
jgi:Mg2+ and Co2+ transporter CorA